MYPLQNKFSCSGKRKYFWNFASTQGVWGVSCINHIKMDDWRSDLGIPNEITDIIKKKRFLFTWYIKTMPVMSIIHTRTSLPIENPEDDQ